MNMCANHPESPAVAYCRGCGKPLCDLCRVENQGAIYCAEHAPAPQGGNSAEAPFTPPYTPGSAPYGSSPYAAPPAAGSSPYATSPGRDASPALALLLGTIPGVGAIYNGQYAKGLIHAVVFGLLISIISSNEHGSLTPLVGMLVAVWWFYMVLEAYHTARKRREGLPVDEFSSILNVRGGGTGFPAGAVVLIALGVLLLLDTSGLVSMDRMVRYWPAALILLGVYMLYSRMERRDSALPHSAIIRSWAMNDVNPQLIGALRGPVILITIGVLFLLDRLTSVGFSQTWPVILIILGVMALAGGRRNIAVPPYVPPPGGPR